MNKQKGMATLLTSIMLIVIITLMAFWGARGSIVEQQSANNAYLTQIAFQNAEQGRVLFMSNIKAYLNTNPTSQWSVALSTAQGTTNSTNSAKFLVAYQIEADGVTATLSSTGFSIGGTTRKVSQRISYAAGGVGNKPAALNSLGDISLSGSTEATSVTAGGQVNLLKQDSVQGAVEGNSNKFQVVMQDINGNIVHRGMTTDEYFMYYFGGLCPVAKAAYATDITKAADCKAEAKLTVQNNQTKGYVCESACGNVDISQLYSTGKRIFWLSSGGIDHLQTVGSEDDPVLIFVMGIPDDSNTAKINAGSTIYGVLYVDITTRPSDCSCYAKDTVTSNNSNVYTWSSTVYGLDDTIQKSVCTAELCAVATNKCIPIHPTSSLKVGNTSTCPYSINVLSSSSETPVKVEILGDWNAGGSGNATFNGAVISSGNVSVTGNASYLQNSSKVTDKIFGTDTAAGIAAPPVLSVAQNSWTDMLN